MADFNIRSDSVNVEDIMRQIRARIREKRGADYTEEEIQEMAAAKLETFLDPTKVRSELLEQFRQIQRHQEQSPSVSLDDSPLFASHRPFVRRLRRLMRPVLKLLLNPDPLVLAAKANDTQRRQAELFYELVHNLVVETTRLAIEVKNLKMKVESLSSRLDFDERRARALEGVVQFKPPAPTPEPAAAQGKKDDEDSDADQAARNRRRRRRRGRRGMAPRPEGTDAAEGVPGDAGAGHDSAAETGPREDRGAGGGGGSDEEPGS
jgi:hypothetical protein